MENLGPITIDVVKRQVENFLHDTMDARALSERDRDYKDHKQWTAEEVQALTRRKQAPIVVNRIRPKVEGLVGLYQLRHTDPKAYPRTRKHENSSHAVTDALRYVADNVAFETTKLEVADEFFVEGYAGAIVQVQQKRNGEVEIDVSRIPWDRIYFDPHSRDKYFDDARYKGMMLWMDDDQVLEMFPDAELDALYLENAYSDETFEDRPRWLDRQRNRIRVALHFYIHRGKWHYCAFAGNTFLIEPQVSPFLDDDGAPTCPIELVCANIDRDNQRFGEVRGFISQQDEINHRRSKALHLLSQRQTAARRGAIKDVPAMKRELAKADGHVQYNGEKGDFEVLNNGDMAQGQFNLYADAKAELDASSFNAQLAGERQNGDLSGRAIEKLQSAGTIELNRQYAVLGGWEKRIYAQVWARIKQFWNEEKWVRITDDQDSLKWVGLNYQTTAQEWMEDRINDEARPLQERKALSATYRFLMETASGPAPQLVQQVQTGDPRAIEAYGVALQAQSVAQARLDEIVSVKNDVAELDMDIIIDQSFDVINAQQEQFNAIVKFAQSSRDIDVIELIELSSLRGKEELIEKIEKRREQAAKAAGNVQQLQAQLVQAEAKEKVARATKLEQEAAGQSLENTVLVQEKGVELSKKLADTGKSRAETTQKNLENLLLANNPGKVANVFI